MDRRVVVRRMAPTRLLTRPHGPDHRPQWRVHQVAVAGLRAGVVDGVGIDAAAEVPRGETAVSRQEPRIGPDREVARQDRRRLDLSGEVPPRRRIPFGRDQDDTAIGKRHARRVTLDHRGQAAVESHLADADAAIWPRTRPQPIPAARLQRLAGREARLAAGPGQHDLRPFRADAEHGAGVVPFVGQHRLVARRQAGPDQRRPGPRLPGVPHRRRLDPRVGADLDRLPAAVEALVEEMRQVLEAPARSVRIGIEADGAKQAGAIAASAGDADMRGQALARSRGEPVEIARDRKFRDRHDASG